MLLLTNTIRVNFTSWLTVWLKLITIVATVEPLVSHCCLCITHTTHNTHLLTNSIITHVGACLYLISPVYHRMRQNIHRLYFFTVEKMLNMVPPIWTWIIQYMQHWQPRSITAILYVYGPWWLRGTFSISFLLLFFFLLTLTISYLPE